MMVCDDVISVTPTFYQYINRFVKEVEYPSTDPCLIISISESISDLNVKQF